jgi:hypothetical protein
MVSNTRSHSSVLMDNIDSDTSHFPSFSSTFKQITVVGPSLQIHLTSVVNTTSDPFPSASRVSKSPVPNTVWRLWFTVSKAVFSPPDRSSTTVQQDGECTDRLSATAKHLLCITHLHAVINRHFEF